jgi:hypothetical protein
MKGFLICFFALLALAFVIYLRPWSPTNSIAPRQIVRENALKEDAELGPEPREAGIGSDALPLPRGLKVPELLPAPRTIDQP